eukprot:491254-Amphidinium_carterae.1
MLSQRAWRHGTGSRGAIQQRVEPCTPPAPVAVSSLWVTNYTPTPIIPSPDHKRQKTCTRYDYNIKHFVEYVVISWTVLETLRMAICGPHSPGRL